MKILIFSIIATLNHLHYPHSHFIHQHKKKHSITTKNIGHIPLENIWCVIIFLSKYNHNIRLRNNRMGDQAPLPPSNLWRKNKTGLLWGIITFEQKYCRWFIFFFWNTLPFLTEKLNHEWILEIFVFLSLVVYYLWENAFRKNSRLFEENLKLSCCIQNY